MADPESVVADELLVELLALFTMTGSDKLLVELLALFTMTGFSFFSLTACVLPQEPIVALLQWRVSVVWETLTATISFNEEERIFKNCNSNPLWVVASFSLLMLVSMLLHLFVNYEVE
jgi:hypothetical protein